MIDDKEEVCGIQALTEEEFELLDYMYRKRLRMFVTAFLVLAFLAFVSGLKIDGQKQRWRSERYQYNVKEVGVSRGYMYLVTIAFLEGIVGIAGIVIYRKRLLPLRKDLIHREKEVVLYTVTQKQHFSHTGQYFVGLNDPDYLFHEVDRDLWQKTEVGTRFGLYRALYSGYVFNPEGRFTIM
jgi:hypothetical protein